MEVNMSPQKMLLFILVVAAILLSSCSLKQVTPVVIPTVVLSELQGTVEIKNPDQANFLPAVDGIHLQVQGQVRTGTDSRLRLDFPSGSILRIAPDSLFTLQINELQNSNPLTRLKLETGQIWIMLQGGELEVETPSGVASVRGSYMSVWVDPLTSDVWVTCVEGLCQTENPTAVLDMVAGEGAFLAHWDTEGTDPPPPPKLGSLSQEDIDHFLSNNPEAQLVIDTIIANASPLPLQTTLVPTMVSSCFELGLPENTGTVSTDGLIQFDWNDQPDAFKYVLTITKPDGTEKSQIIWRSSVQIDPSELPLTGTYLWTVTAFDSNINPICSSGPWSFMIQGNMSTPISTPSAGNCVTLLTPANGTDFPGPARGEFTWSEYPGAYKYIITFKPPSTPAVTFLAWTPLHIRYIESFLAGGTYQWWVTVKNGNLQDICSSQVFTFTKPEIVAPTQLPGSNSGLFWNHNGPTGQQSSCGSLYFSVNTNNPMNGMIKVVYSTNSTPDGNADPHIVIGNSGALSGSGNLSLPNNGQTVNWRFAIFNGTYTYDSSIFSFTCPGSSSGGGGGGGDPFWDQNGPTGLQASCASLNFSVSTSLPGTIKMMYSTSSTNPTDPPYAVIGSGPGSGSQSLSDFSGYSGQTVYWRFAVFNGSYTYDTSVNSFSCP
jgi:hypothetical protein